MFDDDAATSCAHVSENAMVSGDVYNCMFTARNDLQRYNSTDTGSERTIPDTTVQLSDIYRVGYDSTDTGSELVLTIPAANYRYSDLLVLHVTRRVRERDSRRSHNKVTILYIVYKYSDVQTKIGLRCCCVDNDACVLTTVLTLLRSQSVHDTCILVGWCLFI